VSNYGEIYLLSLIHYITSKATRHQNHRFALVLLPVV
jgi:hypothetical protein